MPEITIDTKNRCIDFNLMDVDIESGHFALSFHEFLDLAKEVMNKIKIDMICDTCKQQRKDIKQHIIYICEKCLKDLGWG